MKLIGLNLSMRVQFRTTPDMDLDSVLTLLGNATSEGGVDCVVGVPIEYDTEQQYDLSQQIYQSSVAIMVVAGGRSNFFGALISVNFWLSIATIMCLSYFFALVFWLIEHKMGHNPHFGATGFDPDNPAELGQAYVIFDGIWQSLWYVTVTITTIGYGDKAPVTNAGRVIAIFLMFIGLALFGATGERRGRVCVFVFMFVFVIAQISWYN
jgi:polar amino acid transport system substrate-binding protein